MNKTLDLEFIKDTVNKLVDFVKPTYGPQANKVIVADQFGHKVLDDGAMIANEFTLEDESANTIIQVIKEVSHKTNERVGDGTTGSLILLQALMANLTKDDRKDLERAVLEAVEALKSQAIPVTTVEDLQKVAEMAYANPEIARLIAETVFELGDGVVTVEESQNLETKAEIIEGLSIDQGFVSPYMITNERLESVMEDVPVLVTSKTVKAIHEILPILEKLVEQGQKELVIVADDVEGEALRTFILNRMKGNFNVLGVKAPGFGERKKEYLKDIAVVVGAEFLNPETGTLLQDTLTTQLGRAKRVIATKDKTIFIGGGGVKTEIEARISDLKTELDTLTYSFDKDMLRERISKLSKGVGVIKVGAATEAEMKTIRYKVEDAINATKLAFKSGVVKGAGQALKELNTSSQILNEALKAPEAVLIENGTEIIEIYDPVEVLIASLESAVSIALLLISSTGVIYVTRTQ